MTGSDRRQAGPGGCDETANIVTAWPEMGSATSRNRPGRRHNVRLSGPTRSVIVLVSRVAGSVNKWAHVVSGVSGAAAALTFWQ